MSLTTFIEAACEDPLAIATGHRSIGYVGTQVPVELIIAAQAQALRLRGGVPGTQTARADRFIETSFSASTRRIAEQWLTGKLDALEAVIFSRADDSAQRLYYYLCELQRTGQCAGPKPLLYDIASIDRPSSLAHTIESTRRLADEIGTTSEHMLKATEQVQHRMALLRRLSEHRVAGHVSGSLAHRVVRAAECRWTADFDTELEQWLQTLRPISPHRRLLLVGSEPSHEQLHEAAESAGAVVVAEINPGTVVPSTVVPSTVMPSTVMPSTGVEHTMPFADALARIASNYHQRAQGARALLGNADTLTKYATSLQAEGAILWLTTTDTALAWEVPRVELALRTAGCSVLTLTLQPAECDATTAAKIAHFARTLETP